MKRAVVIVVTTSVLFSLGCVTERDRVAVVRAGKFAAAEGSALGRAVAAELGQVAADIGAPRLDPAAVPLTAEASRENAAGAEAERGARERSWDGLLALLGMGVPGGAALGLLVKALRSGRALAGAQKALGAAVTLTQQVKERLKAGGLSYADFQKVYAAAQSAGPEFVAGSRELYAEYQKMKAAWKATAEGGNNPTLAGPSS